jgi:hypothetical protein
MGATERNPNERSIDMLALLDTAVTTEQMKATIARLRPGQVDALGQIKFITDIYDRDRDLDAAPSKRNPYALPPPPESLADLN